MEDQPTPAVPTSSTFSGISGPATSASTTTGEWPTVPPVPTPVKPVASLITDPPIINPDVHLIPSPVPRLRLGAAGRPSLSPTVPSRTPRPVLTGGFANEIVWQPRFAYTAAVVIMLALTVISLPLWLVLYRLVGTNGAPVADVMALCMMLLGGFLAATAAWVVIVEMRGRVRMVDTLARTGEREISIAPAAPELPMLDTPLDQVTLHPIGAPPPPLAPRVEAQQVSAAVTLEASSKLLSSFSGVLRSFGQLWAQVALLAVALALFIAATVLSV